MHREIRAILTFVPGLRLAPSGLKTDLILRSLRSKRLEGWQQRRTRGHPSRRGQEAAPPAITAKPLRGDEVRNRVRGNIATLRPRNTRNTGRSIIFPSATQNLDLNCSNF